MFSRVTSLVHRACCNLVFYPFHFTISSLDFSGTTIFPVRSSWELGQDLESCRSKPFLQEQLFTKLSPIIVQRVLGRVVDAIGHLVDAVLAEQGVFILLGRTIHIDVLHGGNI